MVQKSFSYLMLGLFLCLVIATPKTIEITQLTLTTFTNALFPSLFIILVFTKLLYYLGIFNNLYNELPKMLKYAFFPLLAILLGFSGNAAFLNTNYDLSEKSKRQLIYSFNLPTFSFTIFTIGYLFKNYQASLMLFSAQCLACCLIFTFSKFKIPPYLPTKNAPFKECLSRSIIESGKSLYIMLAYIIIISSISAMLFDNIILMGLMEFSSSTIKIAQAPLNLSTKLFAITIILGFGSLSSHLQVFNLIETKLNYFTFYCFRLIQCLLANIFLFMLLKFFF